MRVARLADHRVVPWKNGRGSTREIALSPPGATVSDFDWRISVARIDEDGSFSSFPGVDRTLVLLDGAGVDLELPEQTLSLPARHALARFQGESPVFARLHHGPVTDLNVMVRRSAFTADVAVVEAPASVALGGADRLVVVALVDGAVAGGHALVATEAVIAEQQVEVGGGVVLVVRIHRA